MPASGRDIFYDLNGSKFALAGDYVDFMLDFGIAKLFCDYNDAPEVMVYSLESYRRHICKNGKVYVGFGDRGCQHVCFDEDAIISGKPSRVYSISKEKAVDLYPSFSEWLISAYGWAKSKYSKNQWKNIVEGPPPFSIEEMKIVEARKLFKWRLVGFSETNDRLFEVKNTSTITLPYLTIGVRDFNGKILTGGAWLKISHIGPSRVAIVTADCYKDHIPYDQLDVFDLPDPIPEKKDAYWEFKVI
jgi:hypothetical protein